MKLDRNINPYGTGKYAIVNMRAYLNAPDPHGELQEAFAKLQDAGIIDLGAQGTESEFFLIKLKDRNAYPALVSYATSASSTDPEWAQEVADMALRSGINNRWCKEPD